MPTKKAPTKKAVTKPTKKAATKKTAPKKKSAPKAKVMSAKAATKAKGSVKKAAPKKTTAKKAAPKKSAAAKKAAKELVFAADHQSFWTTDGHVLNSLLALSDALNDMETGAFQFHIDGDQNDFSLWIETVLCDGDCAAELAQAKTQKRAQSVVKKHLKNYAL